MPSDKRCPDPEIDAKLRLLQAAAGDNAERGGLLMEYVDSVNRGEPVDKKDLLDRTTSTGARKQLGEDLRLSDMLFDLGKLYREKKEKGEVE